MARTNEPIFQVLVTKEGVAPLLTANQPITSLTPGQIGLFDYETNLSINTADPNTYKRVYIAVGMDRDGDGVTDDVIKSTGEYIESARIHHVSLKCPEDCQGEIIQVQPQNIKGDTEYFIKIILENETVSKLYGKNLPIFTYHVKTGCCESENICSCTDHLICNKLVYDMVAAINLDLTGLVEAVMWDTTNNIEIEADDYEDWVNDSENVDACLAIRLTSNCEAVKTYCNVNYGYTKLRAYNMTVAFMEAGNIQTSAATITTVQDLQYAQGQGYDIQQLEYEAGGWNGKPGPYRQLEMVGGPFGNFEYNAIKTAEYVMLIIGHDALSVVGNAREYVNDMETIICVPCADVVGTLDEIVKVLNDHVFPDNIVNLPLTIPVDCCSDESSTPQ